LRRLKDEPFLKGFRKKTLHFFFTPLLCGVAFGHEPTKETMPEPVSIERVTKDYYDSEDAFCFYQAIWGGESIHIGLYDEIKLASCDGVSHIFVSRFCHSSSFPHNLVGQQAPPSAIA
jgi:hypothetical protein